MIKCNHCGAINNDKNQFCENCGARLNKNLINRFRNGNIFLKLIIIIIAVFVFLVASSWIAYIFFGVPLEPYTEGDSSYHRSEFGNYDINGDGAISFDEVQSLPLDISYDNLSYMFNRADKNDNGVLKAGEFDGFRYRIDDYYKEVEKQHKVEKKQKSSSNSKSNSKEVHFEDRCPYCGSSEIFSYIDSYGYRIYQCSVCDYETYDDDVFIVTTGSINCISPIFKC